MREALLTHESESMEKEGQQLHDLVSEHMKPYFADREDLIGRSPSVVNGRPALVTERPLSGCGHSFSA